MDRAKAFELGYEIGGNIASWIDTPQIGQKLSLDIDWVGIGEIEDESEQAEAFELFCGESESNARQFSPFEQYASEMNAHVNPDEIWDSYEEGVMLAIRHEWMKRKP